MAESTKSSGVEKVLDISGLSSSRGFVASSSDEETDDMKNSARVVGKRLQKLFAMPTVNDRFVDYESFESPRKAVISADVLLYGPDETGKIVKKHRVGAAVINYEGEWLAVIYTWKKKNIATYKLQKRLLELQTQCSITCGFYLCLIAPDSRHALYFSSEQTHLFNAFALYVTVLSGFPGCNLRVGVGNQCVPGNYILFDASQVTLADGELKQDETVKGQKAKITEKSPLWIDRMVGMARGGVRIVVDSDTTAYVVTLRKIKDKSSASVSKCPSDSEDPFAPSVPNDEENKLFPTRESSDVELSQLETDVSHVEKRTSDVIERMAKLGRDVIPELIQAAESLKQDTDRSPADEPTQPILKSQPDVIIPSTEPAKPEADPLLVAPQKAVATSSADFASFHQVVGTEMDRLEMRLESAVQRMIDRSLQPIIDEVKSISATQQKILEELRLLRQ